MACGGTFGYVESLTKEISRVSRRNAPDYVCSVQSIRLMTKDKGPDSNEHVTELRYLGH